eukprot:355166-Chlamydomonas_euryale.AAC.2
MHACHTVAGSSGPVHGSVHACHAVAWSLGSLHGSAHACHTVAWSLGSVHGSAHACHTVTLSLGSVHGSAHLCMPHDELDTPSGAGMGLSGFHGRTLSGSRRRRSALRVRTHSSGKVWGCGKVAVYGSILRLLADSHLQQPCQRAAPLGDVGTTRHTAQERRAVAVAAAVAEPALCPAMREEPPLHALSHVCASTDKLHRRQPPPWQRPRLRCPAGSLPPALPDAAADAVVVVALVVQGGQWGVKVGRERAQATVHLCQADAAQLSRSARLNSRCGGAASVAVLLRAQRGSAEGAEGEKRREGRQWMRVLRRPDALLHMRQGTRPNDGCGCTLPLQPGVCHPPFTQGFFPPPLLPHPKDYRPLHPKGMSKPHPS